MLTLLFFLLGILLGFISGLIPGLHSNTIVSILISVFSDNNALSIAIVAVFAVHSIVSFIPSIFFGVPEEGTVLSVLPGQRLVMEGKGMLALKTVIASVVLAVFLSVMLLPVSMALYPIAYAIVKPYLFYILLFLSLVLILRTKQPLLTFLIFLLAGGVGFAALQQAINDPFLPLFSGMFAIAAILTYQKGKVPKQKDKGIDLSFVPFTVVGVIGGFFAHLFPGIGSPAQVAAFTTILLPSTTLNYLATISAIAISEAVSAFATSASIAKGRIGAVVNLSKIININENIVLFLALFLAAITIAAVIIYLFRKTIVKLAEIDFSIWNRLLAFYLLFITFIIDGGMGVIILIVASLLGYLTIRLGVERSTLMAAIIVPTMILLA